MPDENSSSACFIHTEDFVEEGEEEEEVRVKVARKVTEPLIMASYIGRSDRYSPAALSDAVCVLFSPRLSCLRVCLPFCRDRTEVSFKPVSQFTFLRTLLLRHVALDRELHMVLYDISHDPGDWPQPRPIVLP